jgi:hypothetical protein
MPENTQPIVTGVDNPGPPSVPRAIARAGTNHAGPGHTEITEAMKRDIRIPYGLRHVPLDRFTTLRPMVGAPEMGDIVLSLVEKIGKNTRIELANGRACTLHVGDLVATVFGNRYATMQFEGYARSNGTSCDLMSMGGLCGLVESRHAGIPESSKLRILGTVTDASGTALKLRNFALLRQAAPARKPAVIVVCGSSMDAGKTYTAASLIAGLRKVTDRVSGIKLTGTAAGRDSWTMLDAGARTVLDFVDGGYPSTYLVGLSELLDLHKLLLGHAAARGSDWVVLEIADGLLQGETAALLQEPAFTDTVGAWVFAAGDPLAAVSGMQILKGWGIRPVAISGRVTMSPLCVREASLATGMTCYTAADLQAGRANHHFVPAGMLESEPPSAVGMA